jgi:hypothetical protein
MIHAIISPIDTGTRLPSSNLQDLDVPASHSSTLRGFMTGLASYSFTMSGCTIDTRLGRSISQGSTLEGCGSVSSAIPGIAMAPNASNILRNSNVKCVLLQQPPSFPPSISQSGRSSFVGLFGSLISISPHLEYK